MTINEFTSNTPKLEFKTLKKWRETKLDLNKYMPNVSEVDEDLFWDMIECLPPIWGPNGIRQVGEPMDHDENNNPTYMTFLDANDRYYYLGIHNNANKFEINIKLKD